MTRRLPCIVVAMLCCLSIAGCGEETPEEKRAKLWKEDFKACEKFAFDRWKARELLEYNPEDNLKPYDQQLAESIRRREGRTNRMLFFLEVDRRTCLRGQSWSDESIWELTKKEEAQRVKEANERLKGQGR